MADQMGCDCGGCLPRCLAQAHAEGLEAARRAVCQYPGTDDEHPCQPCQRIRSLAAGVPTTSRAEGK